MRRCDSSSRISSSIARAGESPRFSAKDWWRTSASPIRFARSFPKWCAKPALQAGVDVVKGGTYLCMEGPAFSTKAESNLYRSWGMDVIGMTNLQEAKLAREAEICYVTIAMVTDYDCWHEEHDAVTVTDILAYLAKNAENACKVVAAAVANMPAERDMQVRPRAGARPDHRSQSRAGNHSQESWSCWLENTSADSRRSATCWNIAWPAAPWPEHLLDALLESGGDAALFRIVVERLADLFEPRLCTVYADLFSEVIARRIPELHAEHLMARYERVRKPRRFDRDPAAIRNVFVLSRVTLGADVAITSVLLDAAKQRFTERATFGSSDRKRAGSFSRLMPGLKHLPIAYGRGGTLDDRLSVWPKLREAVCQPNSIVIDPDSRLTQLGLLPICPEEDYYFFESRSYGGEGDAAAIRACEPLGGGDVRGQRRAAVHRNRSGRRRIREHGQFRRRRKSR